LGRLRRALRFLVILPVLLVVGVAAAIVHLSTSLEPGTILRGVTVAECDVGGLDTATALARLEERIGPVTERPVCLLVDDTAFVTTWPDLGCVAAFDLALAEAVAVGRRGSLASALWERLTVVRHGRSIPLRLRLDRAVARARLAELARIVNRPPADASLAYDGSALSIRSDACARALAIDACIGRLEASLADGATTGCVALTVGEGEASITARDLAPYGILGEYASRFSLGQINRSDNIRLATEAVDGTVVPPGWIFSLNGATGERTRERGYKLAGVYSGNETILGYGGGVCQLSSTTYNAALEAKQRVVERHGHSRPVPYVPWGRDATVSWGVADFRFRNETQCPIIVKGRIEENMLHVALVGIHAVESAEASEETPGLPEPEWQSPAARPDEPGYTAPVYPVEAFLPVRFEGQAPVTLATRFSTREGF